MDLKQNPDGSMAFYSDQEGKELGKVGGPKTPTTGTGANFSIPVVYRIPMTGVASPANTTGGVANYQISLNDAVVVTNCQVYVATSAPATSIQVGTTATSGAAASNLMLNYSPDVLGLTDNTKTAVYLAAGGYVTATSNATCANLTGTIFITAHKA